MVTKPGLAGNAGPRFSGGSALENFERSWRSGSKRHQRRSVRNPWFLSVEQTDGRTKDDHDPRQKGERKDSGMYTQYVGFNVAASSRIYNFDVLDTREEPREFTVKVQSEAFRAARLKLQDGPAICFARLQEELQRETQESRAEAHLSIEERDIQEYLEQHYPRAPLAKPSVPSLGRAERMVPGRLPLYRVERTCNRKASSP